MSEKASELWEGVQRPESYREKARLFLNGFIGSDRCPDCGGDMEQDTRHTEAGLADVLLCPDCDRMLFDKLHDSQYTNISTREVR